MLMIELRTPHAHESAALSELCFRSKAHWGYDASFMDNCRAELTVTPDTMTAGFAAVAIYDNNIAGYCELIQEDTNAIIDKLFVSPDCIGKGIGRTLFDAMLEYALRRSVERILIDSDPDAEKFYLAMGARKIGDVPSISIANRMLPQVEVRLPVKKSE